MCWKCGTPIDMQMTISRTSVCGHCGSDIRSCRNCTYYEPGAHYDCHETIDEPVSDKERANFCGWFKVSAGAGNARAGKAAGGHDPARRAFDSLFGD